MWLKRSKCGTSKDLTIKNHPKDQFPPLSISACDTQDKALEMDYKEKNILNDQDQNLLL